MAIYQLQAIVFPPTGPCDPNTIPEQPFQLQVVFADDPTERALITMTGIEHHIVSADGSDTITTEAGILSVLSLFTTATEGFTVKKPRSARVVRMQFHSISRQPLSSRTSTPGPQSTTFQLSIRVERQISWKLPITFCCTAVVIVPWSETIITCRKTGTDSGSFLEEQV